MTIRAGPGFHIRRNPCRGGIASFDAIGGLTAAYAGELTRISLWEAFRKRRCYGTTGARIILDVRCGDKMMGDMFDISSPPEIEVEVNSSDIISEIEIKRGLDIIYSYSETLPANRNVIKVQWSGLRVRSRNKRTNWDGSLMVQNGGIGKVTGFAFNKPGEGVTRISNQVVEWRSSTSGDIDGIEAELDYNENTKFVFRTTTITFNKDVSELKKGKFTVEAGGVNQKVEIGFARIETVKTARIVFTDYSIKPGMNVYWVKVVQKDGHMAWSSPIYINY